MDKREELAQTILDYEEVGYYDLFDAYDTREEAFEAISAYVADIWNIRKLWPHYLGILHYETLSEEEKPLLENICELCEQIIHEHDMAAQNAFEQMVNKYRALGYRMVVFEPPYVEDYGSSSWLAAFDTHGVNADELPIEAFASDGWLKDLRGYASYDGPISEVEHWDVTDDLGEMIGGYDYEANYPVNELVNE